jgi:hypothetical protein
MPQSKLDLEFDRYLPMVNYRQKEVILVLVKAYATIQSDFWEELYKEQDRAVKKLTPGEKVSISR